MFSNHNHEMAIHIVVTSGNILLDNDEMDEITNRLHSESYSNCIVT